MNFNKLRISKNLKDIEKNGRDFSKRSYRKIIRRGRIFPRAMFKVLISNFNPKFKTNCTIFISGRSNYLYNDLADDILNKSTSYLKLVFNNFN